MERTIEHFRFRRMRHEKSQMRVLTPAIGKQLEFVRKNEVDSGVLFRNQIETKAVMRLWERG